MFTKVRTAEVEPMQVLLVTTKQAADALQVSERTVFNLLASGQLPSVKIGAARRISAGAIKKLAKTGCHPSRR